MLTKCNEPKFAMNKQFESRDVISQLQFLPNHLKPMTTQVQFQNQTGLPLTQNVNS